MSRNNLVGSDKKYHQIFLRFKEDFTVRDDLVAVVESEDREKNRQFVERLGAKLEADTNNFAQVFYRGDLKMLGPKALLFLDEPTLLELRQTLKEYSPFVSHFARATNLNALFGMVNQQFRSASRETNAQTETLIKALPALQRIIDGATVSLRRQGNPPSPGITALFGEGAEAQQEQYITFDHGRLYLVNARTYSDEQNMVAVERLREWVRETRREVPGVNVGITGEPVLEYDEMLQSQRDSIQASVLALVLCAFLFVGAYRKLGRPLKATAALILGLGYTMAYTTATVGHLNVLTVTFFPILIGLAIDFGIHLTTRFEEECSAGGESAHALAKAVVHTGKGIFTGCLTTSAAFFAMGLTDFKGIQEMGIITGGGMIVCLLPMMTFLPASLLYGKNGVQQAPRSRDANVSLRGRIEQAWLGRPRTVIALVTVITLLALVPMQKVFFDYNLLNMQSKGLPAVIFEHKLIESASKSVLYAAVVADSREEALLLESRLTNLPSVASVDSMARYLVDDQSRKMEIIAGIKNDIQTIEFAPTDGDPASVDNLSRTLWSLHGYLGLALDELRGREQPELEAQLRGMRRSIEALRYELLNSDPRQAARQLAAYQQALFEDLRQTFRSIRTQDISSPLTEAGLPPFLKTRFIGVDGKHLLQVYPKGDIWDRKVQEEFVGEIRSVAPEATGTPIQLYEYTTLLKNSYIKAAWYALATIVVMVLVHFRRPSAVLYALLPVALGTLWTTGIMGWAGIPFNPANIMILPLVIGIGVTSGIHILNRYAEEQNPSILGRSTGKAVIVSALTTIAGFGSLIPAEHQGIRSLGIVMSLGVGLCMLASITVLPAVLTLTAQIGKRKEPSIDNAQSTLGREEPR